ncbi:Hypothetical predicted protein, partial [Pelobates cultripes]
FVNPFENVQESKIKVHTITLSHSPTVLSCPSASIKPWRSVCIILPVAAAPQSASSEPRFTARKLRVIVPAFQDGSRCMRRPVCRSE